MGMMDNFDPFSDDDVEPPTLDELDELSHKRIAELRAKLLNPATNPGQIDDLKMQIYVLRLDLTQNKRLRDLRATFRPARSK